MIRTNKGGGPKYQLGSANTNAEVRLHQQCASLRPLREVSVACRRHRMELLGRQWESVYWHESFSQPHSKLWSRYSVQSSFSGPNNGGMLSPSSLIPRIRIHSLESSAENSASVYLFGFTVY
ncbi:hypothetical protein ACOSQ2_009206 [Xanthoceras sorbifolium]